MRPIVSSTVDINGFLTFRNEMAGWFSEFDIEEMTTVEMTLMLCDLCAQLVNWHARRWIKWSLVKWGTDIRVSTLPTNSVNQSTSNSIASSLYYANGMNMQNILTLMAGETASTSFVDDRWTDAEVYAQNRDVGIR
ncbi:hypothetical protein M3Y95_00888000 [Aphelenchoides besseyi]|nr:hypothetical protein M3Y95_00888000 [Aphelenchoides besseyi]